MTGDREFSPTDKRLCVCGHPASAHGADPGTKHACREKRSNGLSGYDAAGKPLWNGWHCPCLEFRAAELRSETEVEVFAALARVSPRSWDGVHGDREDEWWTADQVSVQGRTTQGVGIVLGRLAKRGVIEMRRTYMGYYRTRA